MTSSSWLRPSATLTGLLPLAPLALRWQNHGLPYAPPLQSAAAQPPGAPGPSSVSGRKWKERRRPQTLDKNQDRMSVPFYYYFINKFKNSSMVSLPPRATKTN